jgi:uncharacterized damage-inducible protein DinB
MIRQEAIMEYQLDQAVEILRRTPPTLNALLSGLPEAWMHSNAGPGSWNAHHVVGHLLHGEQSDWILRVQMILEYGQERPFEQFDRTAMFEKYEDYPLEQLLDEFAQARNQSLDTLRGLNITPDKLSLKGTHPSLGTVTLSQLLSTWVVHDLNHIGQIVEVMSRQYTEAVGPWMAYLAILTRPALAE